EQLWHRYFPRLVVQARKKLRDTPRRVADEEDIALSAFDSFCRNAEQGRFPQLVDRDGLWHLLVTITARKAAHWKRDQARQKRGGDATPAPDAPGEGGGELEQVLSREPDPAFAAQVAEEWERLLDPLGDPELAAVAVGRMEGRSVKELAAELGYAPRSIKR